MHWVNLEKFALQVNIEEPFEQLSAFQFYHFLNALKAILTFYIFLFSNMIIILMLYWSFVISEIFFVLGKNIVT
jgi:hypothetical protein